MSGNNNMLRLIPATDLVVGDVVPMPRHMGLSSGGTGECLIIGEHMWGEKVEYKVAVMDFFMSGHFRWNLGSKCAFLEPSATQRIGVLRNVFGEDGRSNVPACRESVVESDAARERPSVLSDTHRICKVSLVFRSGNLTSTEDCGIKLSFRDHPYPLSYRPQRGFPGHRIIERQARVA